MSGGAWLAVALVVGAVIGAALAFLAVGVGRSMSARDEQVPRPDVTETPDRSELAHLLRATANARREYAIPGKPHPDDDLLGHEAYALDVAASFVEGDYGHLYDLLPSWRWTGAMDTRCRAGESASTTWVDVRPLLGHPTDTTEED